MPDYDYDEYTRRNLEWEARRAEEGFGENNSTETPSTETTTETTTEDVVENIVEDATDQAQAETEDVTEDDISW